MGASHKSLSYADEELESTQQRVVIPEVEASDESSIRGGHERRTGALLEEILNHIAYPVFVEDEAQRWIFVNDAFCELLGRPREEIIGESACDEKVLTLGGRESMLHTVKSSFINPVTARRNLVGTIRDVAVWRHALRRLEESERRYRRFFENTNVAAFITRVSDGMFLDANRRMAILLGFERSTDIVDTVRIVDHYVDPELRTQILADARSAGEVSEREVQLRGKDGRQRWVRLSAVYNEDEDCLEGACVDITQRKAIEEQNLELERQYLHAQRMEAVGRLAGGIAHDFNNLLCAIKGNASLALAQVDAEQSLREVLNEIDIAADRAASLTRQLLTFSRNDVVTYEVVDLGDLIQSLNRMLVRLIGEDIHLHTRLSGAPFHVHGDRGQLEQVIVNLVVNARDSMPRGGRISVELARRGSTVAIIVSDTGCGMDVEVLARIFEPFFTTKGPGLGTGLGLATVQGIVEQHGGQIEVSSVLGEGSTFTMTLPLVAAGPAACSMRPAPRTLAGDETILVVEDDDLVRSVTVRVLKRYGYHVLVATSGAEGLAIARDHQGIIHLLITDVIMPGMSGIEMASSLVGARPSTKVLFTSGYSADVIATRHAAVPGDMKHLAKPYTLEQLLRRVREALDPTDWGVSDG